MDEIKIVDYPDSMSAASSDSQANVYNNNLDQYYKMIQENTKYNNAWSAEQAARQMEFQNAQAELERQYGSAEAAKNRQWQEYMSNTAHQREIADLKAAGLNPVLSATGGNGAAVTSGAAASRVGASSGAKGDADQSANMAIVSLLNGFLSAMTNLENARVSADANLAVADKYNAMSKVLKEMDIGYSKWEHENYPNNMYQVVDAILNKIGNGSNIVESGKNVIHQKYEEAKEIVNSIVNAQGFDSEEEFVDHLYKNYGTDTRWSTMVDQIRRDGLFRWVYNKLKYSPEEINEIYGLPQRHGK